MLILTRRIGETIVINSNIRVTVLEVGRGGQIKIGVEAPKEVSVHREEVQKRIDAEERAARQPSVHA